MRHFTPGKLTALTIVLTLTTAFALAGVFIAPIPLQSDTRQVPDGASETAPPYLSNYGDSGCLSRSWDGMEPCDEPDGFQYTVTGYTLTIVHTNATYNCCPDEIFVGLVDTCDGYLKLVETEILTTPCDCNCCYDVSSTVAGLTPGTYLVEYCWFDYETWQEQCVSATITVPTGRLASAGPASSPGLTTTPPDVGCHAPQPDPTPLAPATPDESVAHVDHYANSGCRAEVEWACDDPDELELTIAGSTLHVLHTNATYNCCPDDIVISAVITDGVILLTEEEILTGGCYCICCFDVEATIVNLAPGSYTVQFCWYDYETSEQQCITATITIDAGVLASAGLD